MREVVFARRREAAKTCTLTACLGLDGSLVFDEDDQYPPLGADPGREQDEYLSVHAAHKADVLRCLDLAFDGLSRTCGEIPDERLLCALQALAGLGHWQSLDEVEAWLLEHGIPFHKQRWLHAE